MPEPYQSVQSGHSVAQWMLENKDHHWNNETLVYLSIPDGDHLDMLCLKLKSRGYQYSEFIEPDLGNQRTSIAIYDDGKILSRFKLMGA